MRKGFYKSLVCFVLLSSILVSNVFASDGEGGGGIGGGGGGGRRQYWVDNYYPSYDFDPSFGVDTSTALSFLTLEKVDADGNYWFLYHGYGTPEWVRDGTSYVNKSTDSGLLAYAISSSTYPQIGVPIYLRELSAPITGSYSIVLRVFSIASTKPAEDSRVSISDKNNGSSATLPSTGTIHLDEEFPITASGSEMTMIAGNTFSSSTAKYVYYAGDYKSVTMMPTKIYLLCDPIDLSFDTDTRIGPASGDVYYYIDDSNYVVYKDVQFVDETNNTFYNPTTKTWITYQNFNYDYSTYTYNFVLDSGDTYSIEYGDEYIQYIENYTENGDVVTNVYNYYYGGDSGTGGGEDGDGWSFWNWLADRLGAIFDTIIDIIGRIISKIITAIIDWILDLVDAVLLLLKNIFEWFGNVFLAPTEFFDAIGENSGLWEFYRAGG